MENTVIKDVVLDKKFDGYGTNYNNFVAQSEITVTITLNEYRALVVDNAKAQSKIDEANKDKYKRDAENKQLQEQVQQLKAEIYELKMALDTAKAKLDDIGTATITKTEIKRQYTTEKQSISGIGADTLQEEKCITT